MTDRIPLDHLTSDALDALYEQLEAAEQAESQRQLSTAREALASATTRAARAEAALARIRALHREEYGCCSHCTRADAVVYPCPTITALDAPGPAATQATEPGASPLRDLIAAAIYERNNPAHRWADAHPDDLLAYGFDADAVLAVILPATRITATLARMSDADVQRVISLYERWVKAGPPPIGQSINRWWDRRLAELHTALQPAAHNDGPSVEECRDSDRRWPLQKTGE